jgi:hypothetical protein
MWMRLSVPYVVNVALISLLSSACGVASASKDAAVAPAPPVQAELAPTSAPEPGALEASSGEARAANLVPAADEGVAPAAPDTGAPPAESVTAPAPAPPPSDRQVIEQVKKMVDIEARLSIDVEDVRRAAGEVRSLARKNAAVVTRDVLSLSGDVARAELVLRVPATGAKAFLSALEQVGWVRSRQVTEKDIGKQFYDATIRLSNLEAARRRYEEILAQAKNVDEVLRVERELERVRGQIEQIKGELRFLSDRAARATVFITLESAEKAPEVVVRPSAKFYPGVRASYLYDYRGDDGGDGFFGAGLSAGLGPQVALEVLGFRALDSNTSGLDGLFVALSGRIYSEYLGNGTREIVNPYFGLRGGYARFVGKDEILLGGGLGLEIVKTETFLLDSELRASALFGSDRGGHLGLEPTIGVNFAF